MSAISNYLPVDFGWPQPFAIGLIFFLWACYGPILSLVGKGSLNSQLHYVRMQWFRVHHGVHRQDRVFDAILLGHISVRSRISVRPRCWCWRGLSARW